MYYLLNTELNKTLGIGIKNKKAAERRLKLKNRQYGYKKYILIEK